MIYKIANYFLEKIIRNLKTVVRVLLVRDLKDLNSTLEKIQKGDDIVIYDMYGGDTKNVQETIEVIKKRIAVDDQYNLLLDYFKNDPRRSYGINLNFYKYLKAIKYLYGISKVAIPGGISAAPSEIYCTINMVQKSFSEVIGLLALEKIAKK